MGTYFLNNKQIILMCCMFPVKSKKLNIWSSIVDFKSNLIHIKNSSV